MITEKIPEIQKAFDQLNVLSKDKEERYQYEQRQKSLHEKVSSLNHAHRTGKLEGKIEDALNLKNLGVSVEIIAKATGLTIEEIIKLK